MAWVKVEERQEVDVKLCSDCGADALDYDKGERSCKKCGLVQD